MSASCSDSSSSDSTLRPGSACFLRANCSCAPLFRTQTRSHWTHFCLLRQPTSSDRHISKKNPKHVLFSYVFCGFHGLLNDHLGEGDLKSLHRLARDRGCFIAMANIEDANCGHKLLYVNGFPNMSQKLKLDTLWISNLDNLQGQPLGIVDLVVSKTHALASTSEQELLLDVVHLQSIDWLMGKFTGNPYI